MSNARFPALRLVRGPALVLSLAALLSACTPGRIDYRFTESAYDGYQDHWAPYTNSLTADVTGNPFAIPQDDFNKIVNAAIQPSGYPPNDKSAYRLRMIFNGPATNGNYICGDHGDHGGQLGKSKGGTITLAAGYCRGNDPMTFLQGSVSDISGPNDPRLKDFLRMVTVQLFPLPENTFGGPCAMMGC
jgi:hypothetical protein